MKDSIPTMKTQEPTAIVIYGGELSSIDEAEVATFNTIEEAEAFSSGVVEGANMYGAGSVTSEVWPCYHLSTVAFWDTKVDWEMLKLVREKWPELWAKSVETYRSVEAYEKTLDRPLYSEHETKILAKLDAFIDELG